MDTDAILTMMKEVAAELITPRFRSLAASEVMEKSPGDLVTVADREAEVALTARLRQAYPDTLILGEEATAADATLLDAFAGADHAFTIDPVDGTKNFVNGSDDHAVMIGELRSGEVVRGWIYQPEHDLSYVCELGAGATLNGEALRPATRQSGESDADLSWAKGVTSSHLNGTAPAGLAVLTDSWSCAGVDYAQVATGGADYVLFRKDWPWDHVPGSLLVSELGGFTGRLDGRRYSPLACEGWLLSAGTKEIFDGVRGPLAAQLTN